MILAPALYYSREWTFLTSSSCTTFNTIVLLDSRTLISFSFQSFWDIKLGCLGGRKLHVLSNLSEILFDNLHEVALESPQNIQPHTMLSNQVELILPWSCQSLPTYFFHFINLTSRFGTEPLCAWRAWFDQVYGSESA